MKSDSLLRSKTRRKDSLVWATRWIWDECPRLAIKSLQLDWDVYGEAANLFLHSSDYYHLYRCIVLCRRGLFRSIPLVVRRKRLNLISDPRKKNEGTRRDKLRETTQDATIAPSIALRSFLYTWQPLVRELFPSWIENIDQHSIRFTPSLRKSRGFLHAGLDSKFAKGHLICQEPGDSETTA